jgi:ABC-type multidrug transport system ATPase subunit
MRVTVQNIAKAYGFRWALKDVSLRLEPGECVALLGPNGAGKTTLLRLICGLTAPTAGGVYFDGEKLTRSAVELRASLGLLVPGDHLYDNLTARENLKFFLDLYRRAIAPAILDAALDRVGLAERRNDYVAGFSSGMKCRLAIAKWLLLEPMLLLVDEPYGVLDPAGIDLLENFLRDRRAGRAIILLASHHVSRALDLCDRALILRQGRLAFDEPKQQPWPAFERAFGEFLPRSRA